MIKAGETIEQIIEEKGTTNQQLAAELGMSRQSLHQYITRNPDAMRLNKFQEILDKLGYELTVVKKPE